MKTKHIQLIRRNEVIKLTARSKSALQLDEKNGLICPSISIGERAIAYIKSEVEAVLQARIEGRSKGEIKTLVQELVARRKNLGEV